jgi:transcriptional regulator with XRE-family HTH domain
MRKLRLKELLKEKGVSQWALARGTGILPKTISRMVNEPMYNVESHTLIKVADFLKISLDELYYAESSEASE